MAITDIEDSDVSDAVREKRGWFIAFGILLLLIGFAAIASPHVASISTISFIGWFLVISGVAQIIHAFWMKGWRGVIWQLVAGALQALAGLVLLTNPISGVIALTVFLAVMFVLEGVARAYLAFKLRPEAGWVWIPSWRHPLDCSRRHAVGQTSKFCGYGQLAFLSVSILQWQVGHC